MASQPKELPMGVIRTGSGPSTVSFCVCFTINTVIALLVDISRVRLLMSINL